MLLVHVECEHESALVMSLHYQHAISYLIFCSINGDNREVLTLWYKLINNNLQKSLTATLLCWAAIIKLMYFRTKRF